MKNIVLFGGAFDPIHNGHLNMANMASRELDADVIFVPARISVWKTKSISVEDKMNMIALAINTVNKNHFSISRYELDSKNDVCYSIDTVKYFKRNLRDANLYLLIGTDQVNSFDQWKSPDEIASLVQIVYFTRPGLELSQKNIERFHMQQIPGEMVDVSSTDIRDCKSLNLPFSVVEYILSHDLYFTRKIKSYLSDSRFKHSVSVAKLAYEIAVENEVPNPEKYILTGLLHDIGKYVSEESTKRIMDKHFSEYLYLEPMIYHQFVGRYLVERDFDIQDEEILEAIEYHTTGKGDMSDLAKVIYCSDKIEPTRGFNSYGLINAMKVNIVTGMSEVLKSNIEYYESHGVNYKNPLTNACIEQYLIKEL